MARPVLFALCGSVLLSACQVRAPGPSTDPNAERRGQVDPGELLITEVMADPSDCSDARGEWFELKNASRDPLEIDGLTVVDASGDVATIRATAPIPAGSSVVVGTGDADSYCGPGATAFFTGLSLNNGGESLTLYNDDALIDATPYFEARDIRAGVSLQLLPSFVWGSADRTAWYTADQCLHDAGNSPGNNNLDCVTDEQTHFAVLDVPTPVTEAQKHAVLSASRAWIDDQPTTIGYQPLLRSGATLGDLPFGMLTDESGQPIQAADGSHFISAYADFTSLIDLGDDGLYAVTHFEEHPGAMYVTTLSEEADGRLAATHTEPIDFSSIGGLWTPCAGSITPWGTHLGSEEYPSDGREFAEVRTTSDLETRAFEYIRYYGFDVWTDADDDGEPDNAPLEAVLERFSPYRHGYAVEVTVGAGGQTHVERHYAMGRRSLELAKVMPDQRTVYLTDDGTNVGLYLFVADVPGDLSAGRLYALQWNQTGEFPPTADVRWIDLGWADNAIVAQAIDNGVGFTDLFETAPFEEACPAGFRGVNIGEGPECLQLREGQELLASRLESRRYAGYMGATTELRKEEGLAHDPASNTLFVALSAIESGMSDDYQDFDTAGPNHVRLPYNPCGAVFALPLGSDSAIGSDYVASSMRAVIQGRSTQYDELSPYHRNYCDVNSIASPDNLTFVQGRNTLVIGEDTSRHVNDAVWALDLTTGRLDRLLTTPYGAEATSVYWHENLRNSGYSYLMAVAQHPYGESDRSKLQDPADAAAWVGYIGPFEP